MPSLGFKSLTCVIRSFCTAKLVLWRHLPRHCLSNRNRENSKIGLAGVKTWGLGVTILIFWSSWKGQMLHLVIGDQPFNQRLIRLFKTYICAFRGLPPVTSLFRGNDHLQSRLQRSAARVQVTCVFPDQNQKVWPFPLYLSCWQWSNGEITPAKEEGVDASFQWMMGNEQTDP